jgi:hypothetical protein
VFQVDASGEVRLRGRDLKDADAVLIASELKVRVRVA